MIKPTIFVGLGTTGTNILKILRELMSEEYKLAGLPIFRYISIETRSAETGNNRRQYKDYEQITVVNATIENTAPIRSQLDPKQPESIYNPELAKWLDPDILYQIQGFKDGASNIRMAGRLCLWHNWNRIWRTLARSNAYIIEDVNIQETSRILKEHYEAKNLDVPLQLVDDNGINVYVVGTLCGGTCSGMLIDMAYLIRSILRSGNASEVNGIFTMFDSTSAESNIDGTATHAANCYASLSELNFYNFSKSIYDVTFPNGLNPNTSQKPFDYELLVSPSGNMENIRFVSGGKVDEKGLSLMVALNLFAEAAGDTDGHKKDIRTDWINRGAGYGDLKPVPTGEIPTMVKCLSSFGLTAVWYPKFRIASAAACYASMELCKNLKGVHTTDDKIKASAINEWNKIRVNVDILTSPQVDGRLTLMGEIETDLNNLESEVLNQKLSSQVLERKLNSYPNGDAGSYGNRFSDSGTYYAWIEGKVKRCKEAFEIAIDNALIEQLSKVYDSPDSYGINDVQHFFQELDKIIKATQDRIKNELPILNLDTLNFHPMKRTEDNPWIKRLGKDKGEEAVNSHRKNLIKEYRQLILGGGIGIYHKMRYFFLRQVLDDVRTKLGFEGGAETNTIKQQLDEIQSNLDNCIVTLNEEYKENIHPPGYKCVKIVANNPQNSIQIDAEKLGHLIVGESINDEMCVEDGKQIKKDEFLKKGDEYLSQQMSETYQRTALNKINAGDEEGTTSTLVVTKAQDLLNNAGHEITNLAARSNPYQEFSPGYKQNTSDIRTKIVFGHDPTGQGLNTLKNALEFERTGNSYVDHLLFFYEEEAGFTFDDLAVYVPLRNHYNRSQATFGHWTHQNPDFYDLKLQPKSADLKRWCHALIRLVPKIRENHPNAFDTVFEFDGNEGISFKYKDRMGVHKTLSLSDDTSGIDSLCSVENDSYYNYFFESIKAEFHKLGLQVASGAVNNSLKEIDRGEQDSMGKLLSAYLEEIFPDADETVNPPPVPEPDIPDTSTNDAFDEEPSEKSNDQETEPLAGVLDQLQKILSKPESERTETEKALIQLLQQTSEGVVSNESSITEENSKDQDRGVELVEQEQ